MTEAILVLNAGSSSLKFALFQTEPLERLYRGQVEDIGDQAWLTIIDREGAPLVDASMQKGGTHEQALAFLLDRMAERLPELRLVGAGHRVVHGGQRHTGPARIDGDLLAYLDDLTPLAPLHQPHNLAGIRALAKHQPDLPQIACFDTAFHRTLPRVAQMFALPRELTDSGIVRYGFHGLSYAYIASVLPEFLGPDAAAGRVVVAHLGHGASMAAIHHGRSIATTMGFTALDGLPMGQRSGSLDPGVILHLLDQRGFDVEAVTDLLYHRSGLLGVSGISDDMQTLLASDEAGAKDAIELFAYRISRELGSLTAALGGLDAVVFTGGIGEHATLIRRLICEQAGWLGVHLDSAANEANERKISLPESSVSAWVIPTNEELMIARQTISLIQARH